MFPLLNIVYGKNFFFKNTERKIFFLSVFSSFNCKNPDFKTLAISIFFFILVFRGRPMILSGLNINYTVLEMFKVKYMWKKSDTKETKKITLFRGGSE
jgi:hypothetical protein